MKPLRAAFDLLRKYDVPGPRYTSYPPATRFSAPPPDPLPAGEPRASLYVHVPFCRTRCLYCGCNTSVCTDPAEGRRFLRRIEREIALRRPFFGTGRVVQLHLGGGTPTFLAADELRALAAVLRRAFPFADEVEAGVEIDPRTLDEEKAAALREAGFNRASLGVQDTDPAVQRLIGRVQPLEQIDRALRLLREAGFASVNFDLIYGLPGQTPASFARTLREILALSPDRLAVYGYAHVPWLRPLQKRFEDRLPDPETRLRLLQLTIETLTGAGYRYIGMDHFARPEDPLARALDDGTLQRNFQGYTTHRGTALHAFGPSAISFFAGRYFQNARETADWYAALDAGRLPWVRGYRLTDDDRLRAAAITRIMCDLRIDYAAFARETGVDFPERFREELRRLDEMERDGLVRRDPDGLTVTPLGRLFLRNIAMCFDAGLESPSAGPRYSRTV